MRVGMGYDVHRLAEDRKMILGGVEIPYEKGLLGHSDADVLVHAIMDALLGAAAKIILISAFSLRSSHILLVTSVAAHFPICWIEGNILTVNRSC